MARTPRARRPLVGLEAGDEERAARTDQSDQLLRNAGEQTHR